jgi:ribonuclease D
MDAPSPRKRRRRRRRGRPSRRAEGHDAAQEAAELEPDHSVPEHPLIPAGTPELIETPEDLADLVEHVRAVGSFAYDTEFIGEETYHPRFCLIQIATGERLALVDPLADLDVTSVWELVADPECETIVHAGQQDLEPVVRFLDRSPAAIFDTQIAAAFVDRPYPLGLRQLVEEFVGLRLGKALTFTRWDRRPLSKVHLRYAANDVRYLPAVRAALDEELGRLGHRAWARAECDSMCRADLYRFNPDARLTRILGTHQLKPRKTALLRELIILRNKISVAQDQPPRTLLKDEVLVRLARNPARTPDEVGAVKGMPWPVAEAHGQRILDITERVLALPSEDLPRKRGGVETPTDRVRIDSLWALVSAYCLGRAISPALVGNRARVAEYYFQARAGTLDGDCAIIQGWRGELVGAMLETLRQGGGNVSLRWGDERLESQVSPGDS